MTNNRKFTKIDAGSGCESENSAKSRAESRKQLKGSASNGGDGDDIKVRGKGGPRFRDLGGMEEVL